MLDLHRTRNALCIYKMHPVISPTNPEVSIVEKPKWTIIYKRSINIIALSLANVSIISISSFDANLQALKLKKYENNLLKQRNFLYQFVASIVYYCGFMHFKDIVCIECPCQYGASLKLAPTYSSYIYGMLAWVSVTNTIALCFLSHID